MLPNYGFMYLSSCLIALISLRLVTHPNAQTEAEPAKFMDKKMKLKFKKINKQASRLFILNP
jgi:hypothetical protein